MARGVPDPWAEVRVATAEADKLEALERSFKGFPYIKVSFIKFL